MPKINRIILFSVFLFIFIFALKVNGSQSPDIYLKHSYEIYKKNFMSQDGRIIDYDKNNTTSSKDQSYMMLRALTMNDKKTFNLVYTWTKDNLQMRSKLFAQLWGKNESGEYEILNSNSASDADVDIAFALLLAHKQWENYDYLEEALPIVQSIWYKETKQIGDYLVLMPSERQASQEKIEVNTSSFSPYAFKLFQTYDEIHDWELLVDSSYYYLNKTAIDIQRREASSLDSIRAFAKIYLDYTKTSDKRALSILKKLNCFTENDVAPDVEADYITKTPLCDYSS